VKYRKRPVVIEAFQLTAETRWDNHDWPEWLNQAWNKERDEEGAVWPASGSEPSQKFKDSVCITTLEGIHRADPGDWIIQGVKGELYPCKPDIFETTYEGAETDAEAAQTESTA
jgi:hypothetical protein